MMKKVKWSTLLIGVVFLFSCASVAQDTAENIEIEDEFGEVNYSFDWIGTYEGMLPCADCEGIETTITLNSNGTYQKVEVYLKGGERSVFEINSDYRWNEASGILTFKPAVGEQNGEDFKYKVAGGKLKALDREGEEITSQLAKFYILDRVE